MTTNEEIEHNYDRLNARDRWDILDFSTAMVHRYVDDEGKIPKDKVSHLVSDVTHSFSYSLHCTLNDLGIANYGELKELARKYKNYKGD